jgi:hypothetical protein
MSLSRPTIARSEFERAIFPKRSHVRRLFAQVLAYTIAIGTGVVILFAFGCGLSSMVLRQAASVDNDSRRICDGGKNAGQSTSRFGNNAIGKYTQADITPTRSNSPPDDDGGFNFSFVVSNNTGKDVQLSANGLRIYLINSQSRALIEQPEATIKRPLGEKELPILLPPARRVTLEIHLARSLKESDATPLYRKTGETLANAMPRVTAFLHERAPTFSGFAILDDQGRYDLELPFKAK